MNRPGLRLGRYDRRLHEEGFTHVAGADEVGRGCLAGPIVAAAVVLRSGAALSTANDSKALAPQVREDLAARIRTSSLAYAFAFVGPRMIDRVNVRRANLVALTRAVSRLRRVLGPLLTGESSVLLLVDGIDAVPDAPWPQRTVVGGDARSLAIACASIVAKTVRDRFMIRLAALHPGYGFESHKGYSTAEHLDALERLGPCAWHRHSFTPVAQPSLFPRRTLVPAD